MARKPLGKKLRFEVFKRDSFTCQYCGGKSPDVVLHVDHIQPVAAGGGDDILNLVTACITCNSGKGAEKLSDNSAIAKQRAQLEQLNERREQLEMLIQWRDGMSKIDDVAVERVCDEIGERTGYAPVAVSRADIAKWIKKFGFSEVLESAEKAFEQYFKPTGNENRDKSSWLLAFSKIPMIATNRKKYGPDAGRILYLQGIVRQRLKNFNVYCADHIAFMVENDVDDLDSLTDLARTGAIEDVRDVFLGGTDG
jgi:hypothetical protein